MSNPVLDYRSVQKVANCTSQNGVSIEMRSEVCWNSANPNGKKLRKILTVKGELEEKGAKYPVAWSFDFPDGSRDALKQSLDLIFAYAKENTAPVPRETEVSIQVFDWLKIGLIRNEQEISSYYEFIKNEGGEKIRALFKAATALIEVRMMLSKLIDQ
jgi:hypothetical protein